MLKQSKNLLKLSSLIAIASSIIACDGATFDGRPLETDPSGEATPTPVTPTPVTPTPVTPTPTPGETPTPTPEVTPIPTPIPTPEVTPVPSVEIDADLLASVTNDVVNTRNCSTCHSVGSIFATAIASGFAFDRSGPQTEEAVEALVVGYAAAAAGNLDLLRNIPSERNGATHGGGGLITPGTALDDTWLEFLDQVSAVVNSGSSKPSLSFTVNCEGDIAGCIDDMSRSGGGTVVLAAKTYELTSTIDLVSGVDIIGQGSETIITFSEEVSGLIDAPLIYGNSINDVALKSFALECGDNQVSSDQLSLIHI